MILANKLLEYLKETGTTRNDLAENADVSLSTLNAILNGRTPNPTYFTAIQLAKAAGISLDEIGGITSKDMGSEEIERIKRSYQKNEEEIKKVLSDYSARIAHYEELGEFDKETIRRQDLRMDALRDRVEYQKKAIWWLRFLSVGMFTYSLLITTILLFVIPKI